MAAGKSLHWVALPKKKKNCCSRGRRRGTQSVFVKRLIGSARASLRPGRTSLCTLSARPPPPPRQCWFTSARTSVGTQQKQATPALAWAVLGGQFPPCRQTDRQTDRTAWNEKRVRRTAETIPSQQMRSQHGHASMAGNDEIPSFPHGCHGDSGGQLRTQHTFLRTPGLREHPPQGRTVSARPFTAPVMEGLRRPGSQEGVNLPDSTPLLTNDQDGATTRPSCYAHACQEEFFLHARAATPALGPRLKQASAELQQDMPHHTFCPGRG